MGTGSDRPEASSAEVHVLFSGYVNKSATSAVSRIEPILAQRMVNTYWHLDLAAHSACLDKTAKCTLPEGLLLDQFGDMWLPFL